MDDATPTPTRPPLSSTLTENQLNLAEILVENNRTDLRERIRKFTDDKAQVEFFDQVKRRYLPLRQHQEDLPAYIRKGGQRTVKSYIEIVEQLLAENPYDGFSPPTPVADLQYFTFKTKLRAHLNSLRGQLSYANESVVIEHVYKVIAVYHKLLLHEVVQRDDKGQSSHLLELRGNIHFNYRRDTYGRDKERTAPITIRLPVSYPQRRPHVWINCPDHAAIVVEQLNVAPNGLVSIPYLVNWAEDKSDLVTLVSHLRVDFCSQNPIFPIDLGIQLSFEQTKLVKILIDYGQMHLFAGIAGLPKERIPTFFNQVIQRYPRSSSSHVDLAHHIRTTKGALEQYVNIVANLLGVPPKKKGKEDVANLDFI